MARSRIVVRRGGVVTRRQNVWLGVNVQTTAIAAATAVLVASLNAAALALRPFTVVRTRMLIRWSSDQSAATERPFGAIGQIVVSDEAAAAGVASIPDPVTNPSAPWFFYEPLSDEIIFKSGVGIDSGAGYVVLGDSKSMRKVGQNEDITLIATNSSSTDGANVVVQGRILVKLH